MLFLTAGEKVEMGKVSRIKENRQYEYVSIEHFGIVKYEEENTLRNEVKNSAEALKSYTFKENDGKAKVLVVMDPNEKYADMVNDMWKLGILIVFIK